MQDLKCPKCEEVVILDNHLSQLLNVEIKCNHCEAILVVDYDEVKKDDDWVWKYWLIEVDKI